MSQPHSKHFACWRNFQCSVKPDSLILLFNCPAFKLFYVTCKNYSPKLLHKIEKKQKTKDLVIKMFQWSSWNKYLYIKENVSQKWRSLWAIKSMYSKLMLRDRFYVFQCQQTPSQWPGGSLNVQKKNTAMNKSYHATDAAIYSVDNTPVTTHESVRKENCTLSTLHIYRWLELNFVYCTHLLV